MNSWHYSNNGCHVGPVSEADVRGGVRSGLIKRDTYVWTGGWEQWRLAGSVPGLFAPPLPQVTHKKTGGLPARAVSSDTKTSSDAKTPTSSKLPAGRQTVSTGQQASSQGETAERTSQNHPQRVKATSSRSQVQDTPSEVQKTEVRETDKNDLALTREKLALSFKSLADFAPPDDLDWESLSQRPAETDSKKESFSKIKLSSEPERDARYESNPKFYSIRGRLSITAAAVRTLAIVVVYALNFSILPVLATIICLPFLFITLAKRCHDAGNDATWALWLFVPYINFVAVPAIILMKGDAGDNVYGPAPARASSSSGSLSIPTNTHAAGEGSTVEGSSIDARAEAEPRILMNPEVETGRGTENAQPKESQAEEPHEAEPSLNMSTAFKVGALEATRAAKNALSQARATSKQHFGEEQWYKDAENGAGGVVDGAKEVIGAASDIASESLRAPNKT